MEKDGAFKNRVHYITIYCTINHTNRLVPPERQMEEATVKLLERNVYNAMMKFVVSNDGKKILLF